MFSLLFARFSGISSFVSLFLRVAGIVVAVSFFLLIRRRSAHW